MNVKVEVPIDLLPFYLSGFLLHMRSFVGSKPEEEEDIELLAVQKQSMESVKQNRESVSAARPESLEEGSSGAPIGRPISRATSAHSVRKPFHRESSVIDAVTGRKVRRVYSLWDTNPQEIRDHIVREREGIVQPLLAPATYYDRFRASVASCFTKPVIKASIAYMVASLAVYSPFISGALGNSDSKHLVCTVVVYFHASRTKGSMIQSIIFVALALGFGFFVSIGLMQLSSILLSESDPSNIGSFSILALCSASLGFVSFTKHKVSKDTFNTACSLCAIVIVSCVIKEGSLGGSQVPWGKIWSTFLIVLTGCFVSVAICYTLWPTDGTERLRKSLNTATDSLSLLFLRITTRFLSDEGSESTETDRLLRQLRSNMLELSKNLEESRYEYLLKGQTERYELLDQLAACTHRMVSNISGLNRSVEFKSVLLEKREDDEDDEVSDQVYSIVSEDTGIADNTSSSESSSSDDSGPVALVPRELFDLFVYHQGPSMKSYTHTMRQILEQVPFEEKSSQISPNLVQFQSSLQLATELFQQNEAKSLERVYQQEIFTKETDFEDKLDQEQVAASSANFAFSMIQFGNELSKYLEILRKIDDLGEYPSAGSLSICDMITGTKKIGISSASQRQYEELSEDSELTTNHSVGYALWLLYRKFWETDYQFGVRVGLGAMAIGAFAYMDSTKHLFNEWRGEWALITFCIIMNRSVGGTNMTVKWRFLGTFFGAVIAYAVWQLFYPNWFLMALSGMLVSLPCYHIILNWETSSAFGRFILLTYNLTVLYSYTMALEGKEDAPVPDDPEGGDDPIIFEIAFHRFVGVSVGVLWAVIVTLTLFPVSARSRLRSQLSSLWLHLGLLWKEGPLKFAKTDVGGYKLLGIPAEDRQVCHECLGEVRVLLKQAPMEFRLKGPFPTTIYGKMVDSTSSVLDAVENMNSIVDFDTSLNESNHLVIVSLLGDMGELQNRVFLAFYMLSSSLRLGMPLAGKPASTENAMERLLVKLSEIRDRTSRETKQPLANEDFVLFYTYALVINSIACEIDRLVSLEIELYGTISRETLFEGRDV
ncbi:DEKNAAC100533 [Brettanomyces naardenensis]|uniref:DEKNAAC100533 n=1 Tax=Brettanomyces naardenensis TaxID=13370 RepID=A0A448YGR7_BRENA|nr:DEKNAAC100533 [Brettanomyces naardenensis]